MRGALPHEKKRVGAGTIVRLAAVVLFFTAAPTVGEIGSCGQPPDEMDPVKFYTEKERIDCEKCIACEIVTDACARACEPELDLDDFPKGCRPLVHDGEVCLGALEASGCDAYRYYMSDGAPTIPTECNFCPPCVDADGGAPEAGSPDLPRCD